MILNTDLLRRMFLKHFARMSIKNTLRTSKHPKLYPNFMYLLKTLRQEEDMTGGHFLSGILSV